MVNSKMNNSSCSSFLVYLTMIMSIIMLTVFIVRGLLLV